MKSSKAIEIIDMVCNDKGKVSDTDLWKALKMAHGALKIVDRFRAMGLRLARMRLPGETKE